MSSQIYFWVGGSTGSTLPNRFSWNEASNWRISTGYDSFSDTLSTEVATDVPAYDDTAVVGGFSPEGGYFSTTATSPLLFGGFSGGLTMGGWTSGSYGNTGIQWSTSLDKFIIAGNQLLNLDSVNSDGYTFNYPFPIVGGGLFLGGQLDIMKKVKVEGMTSSNWDALYAQSTPNKVYEKQLKIKSTETIINIDGTRAPINWLPSSGVTSTNRDIKLEMVDNYATGISANVSSIIVFGTNTRVSLNASKVQYVSFTQPVIWFNLDELATGSWKTSGRNADNNTLNITNSVVEDIELFTFTNTTIRTSIIGRFKYNQQSIINSFGKNYLDIKNPTFTLGGTFDSAEAARAMRLNPVLTGLTYANILIDCTGLTLSDGMGNAKSSLIVNLGDNSNNRTTPRIQATNIKIIGPEEAFKTDEYNTDPRPRVTFINWGNVNIMDVYKTRIDGTYGPFNGAVYKDIKIRTLFMNKESTLDFTKNKYFKNWKFGEINQVNYYGGIVFDNPTKFDVSGMPIDSCEIIGSSNVFLLPYGVVGGRNTRSGQNYSGYEEFEASGFYNKPS
jgi:hypothetical protein